MLSQIKTLRESLPKTPIVNPLDLYSVYDDYSNGDLALGSFAGTDLKGSNRAKIENTNALEIADSVLEVSNTTGNAALYNSSVLQALSYPCMAHISFNLLATYELFWGVTNDISVRYRPKDGLRLNGTTWHKRVADSESTLSLTFDDYGERVGIVLVLPGDDTISFYYKNQTSIYSELASFAVTDYVVGFYVGASYRVFGATPGVIYKMSAVETAYQSIGQLEALFPLA